MSDIRIQAGLVNETNIIRSHGKITGVKTSDGEKKVFDVKSESDVSELTELAKKSAGDLYVKVDNRVIKLSLKEPSSREELLKSLYSAIDKMNPNEIELKANLIKVYTSLAKPSEIKDKAELDKKLKELDSKLAARAAQDITTYGTQFTSLNEKIDRRNYLREQLEYLEQFETKIKYSECQESFEINCVKMTKEQALAKIKIDIAKVQAELKPLEDLHLEKLVTEKYADAVRRGGPIDSKLKEIDQNLEVLTEQFNKIKLSIDTATANGDKKVIIDGKTYTLEEAKIELEKVNSQISSQLEEAKGIFLKLQNWSKYVPDMEKFNRVLGESLSTTPGFLTSFLSSAGISRNPESPFWSSILPDTTPTTTYNKVHNVISYSSKILAIFHDIPANIITIAGREPEVLFIKGLGKTAQKLCNALSKVGGSKIFEYLDKAPDGIKKSIAEMLEKMAASMDDAAIKAFAEKVGPKLNKALGAAGMAFAAYGAGYYGSIALGLNYPNVEIGEGVNKTVYELRPSPETRVICGLAAAIDAAAVAAGGVSTFGTGGTGAAGASLACGIASLFGELTAEYFLSKDQARLEAVHNNILMAKNGTQMREGIRLLREACGGTLKNLHEVLGQVGINDKGDIVRIVDDKTNSVDRELSAAVMNKILQFGVEGKLSKQEVQQVLMEMLSGVDERLTSGDDVVQSFFNQLKLKFGDNQTKYNQALNLLGPDIRLKLFKMLDEGFTSGENVNFLNESSKDLSEAKIMEILAMSESDITTRGRMIATLLDGFTRERFENLAFNLIEKTRNECLSKKPPDFNGFKKLVSEIRLDPSKPSLLSSLTNELSSEKVGKILAWMVQAGVPQDQINDYIKEASKTFKTISPSNWFTDDNITLAFINEVKTLNLDLSKLPSENMKTLFHTLDNSGNRFQAAFGGSTEEYKGVEFLAKYADIQTKKYMIEEMMTGKTFFQAEKAIASIITQTKNPDDQKVLLESLNLFKVGTEMEDPATAAKIMKSLFDMGFNDKLIAEKLGSFLDGVAAQWHLFDDVDDDSALIFVRGLRDKDLSKLPDSIQQKLFKSLDKQEIFESSKFRTDKQSQMERLISAMKTETKAAMIKHLMDENTGSDRETIIYNTLMKASSTDFNKIINLLNTGELAKELENPNQYAKIMARLGSIGDSTKFEQFIQNSSTDQVKSGWHAMSWNDARELNDHARLEMFKKFVDAGDLKYASDMILGSKENGLKGVSVNTRNKMIEYLSSNITKFNNTDAGCASAWVLAYGSQTQIDTTFSKISTKWFGQAGTIVKAAIDQANAQGLDIKGKLSMNTLQSMVGSLNNGWTKLFGNYEENLKYIRELAQLVNTNGKISIIKDLMDGWTPGTAETLIHDIFKDTKDHGEFTRLVDGVGAKKISKELEDRGELGRVMAFIVERYQGDKSKTLNDIMSQWSNLSIKSDDIIWNMLKQLESDRALEKLKWYIDTSTLETMIDWTDDPFRDGNVLNLDEESKWSIKKLKEAMNWGAG